MRKPTPEDRERIERLREENRKAAQEMQEIMDRVEARRQARREEWLNRPRGFRRLLFWTR